MFFTLCHQSVGWLGGVVEPILSRSVRQSEHALALNASGKVKTCTSETTWDVG